MMNNLCFAFILFCVSCNSANKDEVEKKLSFEFDWGYDYDSLIFYINDSLVIRKKIKTEPSLGLAANVLYSTKEGNIKVTMLLNGNKKIDSVFMTEHESTYSFSYTRNNDSIMLMHKNGIYLRD